MKGILVIVFLMLGVFAFGQETGHLLAMNNSNTPENAIPDTNIKRFKGSESPDYTFIVNSNVRNDVIVIETNYTSDYKIRFIDYWGRSVKVYRNVSDDKLINVSDLGKGIFIMNITDAQNNKLLTSQVVNLKRRHL